jgi:hypothetical protein
MTLALVIIHLNEMSDNKKRDLVFNWLVGRKYWKCEKEPFPFIISHFIAQPIVSENVN